MTDTYDPPLPPCRHCGLAVELRGGLSYPEGRWFHRSTNSLGCPRGGTVAEPTREHARWWTEKYGS